MNLENGKLYWVKSKRYNKIYLTEHDSEWADGGCFCLIGNDDIFCLKDVDVLDKVKLVVPEYAKDTGYD